MKVSKEKTPPQKVLFRAVSKVVLTADIARNNKDRDCPLITCRFF
jgi:hypothetical protein